MREAGRRLKPYGLALLLVLAMTLLLIVVTAIQPLQHVSSAYLIPVIIAAIRLGVGPAIFTALGGVAASAFFFYAPIYDFRVYDTGQLLDLPLFVLVAMVTGQLAARARRHAERSQRQAKETGALYALSRRLAVATDAAQIRAAVQEHASAVTGRRVLYIQPDSAAVPSGQADVPERVAASARSAMAEETPQATSVIDPQTQSNWVIVPVLKPVLGVFAIEMGQVPRARLRELSSEIERALADASATLDRLDVAQVMQEAELRARAVTLREALIGSVTHGLRTPLASIVGSASVLREAQPIKSDSHLAELADIIRDEADRLDRDIQKLLDSTRISSAGVNVHAAWTDPGDIVNAALADEERALARHVVESRLGDDLPLVQVDPVLVEQALRLILDNAARYSPPGSRIRVAVLAEKDVVKILIEDEGLGLNAEDRQRVFERFYRGDRVGEHTGTGLGLWIARAFITACGGSVAAESAGPGRGTQIIVALPPGAPPDGAQGGGND